MLELDHVSKLYKKDSQGRQHQALWQLSCEFAVGQVTALVGHNGAGKTTAMRLALGLIKPDSGSVRIAGQAPTLASKAFVGYMPETSKLPLRLTPTEVLTLHWHLYPQLRGSTQQRQQRIGEHLQQVGLWEHRRKFIGQLSKGMARRLAWAVATMHQPRLVILDEPFSGLDPAGRRDMRQWVQALKAQGTTVVLSSHELATLPELCEHILMLHKGRLVKSISLTSQVGWQLAVACPVATAQTFGLQAALPLPLSSKALADQGQGADKKIISRLLFADHAQASQWLQACSRGALPIVSFGQVTGPSAEDLWAELDAEEAP